MSAIKIKAKKYGQVTKIYIDNKEVCSMPSIPSACIKQIRAVLEEIGFAQVEYIVDEIGSRTVPNIVE